MKKPLLKLIKIPAIILTGLIILITAAVLLLSIFFPNEYVRQEIEKRTTVFLGVQVKLEKLKFTIFRGFILKGFSINQYGKGWKYPNILTIDTIRLDYRLFPLLKKEISVKAFTIEEGTIHLEKKEGRENWKYFMGIMEMIKAESNKKTKKEKKKDDKEFSRSKFPIDINISQAGLKDFNVTYDDDSFLKIPLFAKLSDIKLLAKNIDFKKNEPFDLEGKIQLSLDADKYLGLGARAKAKGKIKIFEGDTSKIAPTGPIRIDLIEAKFNSDEIKGLLIKFIEDYIESTFGKTVKNLLNNPSLISTKSDEYFNSVLNSSDKTIEDTINKAQKLLESKEGVTKYSNDLLNDFDKKIDSAMSDINKKMDEIDKRINPVMDRMKNSPLADNIGEYKKKVDDLKKRVNSKKDNLRKSYRGNLESSFTDTINSNFPAKIPNRNDFKKQFTEKVAVYKKEINKTLKNYSLNEFINSIFPDLSFLDGEWKIKGLSCIYNLGTGESKVENLDLICEYFDLKGGMKIKKKYIDYTGDLSANIGKFNLSFIPVDKLTAKVGIYGDLPKFKIKFLENPKLKLDDKNKDQIINTIMDNFLKNNYGDNKIISSILKGFSTENIDINKIKNILKDKKTGEETKLDNDKTKTNDYIDNEIEKIIDEMNNGFLRRRDKNNDDDDDDDNKIPGLDDIEIPKF